MTFLASIPGSASLSKVFRRYPGTARPLAEFTQILMRGPSPLSQAERETIAAFVSGLNRTDYCLRTHEEAALALGADKETVAALLWDVETAQVPDKLKPLLAFVMKLNNTPADMTPEDAEAVFAAGWDERALHDAVQVCAAFNLYNRLIEGWGLSLNPADPEGQAREFGEGLAKDGYLMDLPEDAS